MTTKKGKIDKEDQIPVQIILKGVITRPDTENRTNKVLPAIKISLQFPNERIKARLIIVDGQDSTPDATEEGDRITKLLIKHKLAQLILKESDDIDKKNQIPVQIILEGVIVRPDTENRTNKVLPAMKISFIFPKERIEAILILMLGKNKTNDASEEADRIKQKLLENQPGQILLKNNGELEE